MMELFSDMFDFIWKCLSSEVDSFTTLRAYGSQVSWKTQQLNLIQWKSHPAHNPLIY